MELFTSLLFLAADEAPKAVSQALDLSAVAAVWFVSQGNLKRGIYLLDRHGDSLLQLTHGGGDATPYQFAREQFGR